MSHHFQRPENRRDQVGLEDVAKLLDRVNDWLPRFLVDLHRKGVPRNAGGGHTNIDNAMTCDGLVEYLGSKGRIRGVPDLSFGNGLANRLVD